MLIEVTHFDELEELDYKPDDIYDFFKYENLVGEQENYMFRVKDFYDFPLNKIEKYVLEEVREQIKEVWNWFADYLNGQNKQIDM